MSVWVSGDTHGELQIGRLSTKAFPQGKKLTKDDYVIICGDFGILWKNEPDKTEKYWLKFLKSKPWTTLFVDGNHENFSRLNKLPTIEKFGGKVDVINDKVFHLRRGEIYTINDKTFFCFGGAISRDKHYRVVNVSWWEQEVPSKDEMEYATRNLEKVNYKVDYIITHTAPECVIYSVHLQHDYADTTTSFLQFISDHTQFERWYCGHLHLDQDVGKYTVLWDRILKVE